MRAYLWPQESEGAGEAEQNLSLQDATDQFQRQLISSALSQYGSTYKAAAAPFIQTFLPYFPFRLFGRAKCVLFRHFSLSQIRRLNFQIPFTLPGRRVVSSGSNKNRNDLDVTH